MNLPSEQLRNKLKLRHLEARDAFAKKHPHAKNFFEERGIDLGKIRRHSAKLLTAGTLGGALLLSPPKAKAQVLPLPEPIAQALTATGAALPQEPREWLADKLRHLLPPISNRWGLPFLSHEEEKAIGRIIERATGVPARATLEGEHLNTTYGYIGAEQHLPRYPGDTISQHDELQEVGITASRGAFGWFSENGKLTEDAVQREKYYVAVQTLYLPDWDRRWKYLKDWYKWRKVVVVDPDNGNAVVAVVGDAGPAAWTGKHFGGSPEVMNALGGPRYKKGRVLLFFVDDPDNKIPLGPVDYGRTGVAVVKSDRGPTATVDIDNLIAQLDRARYE